MHFVSLFFLNKRKITTSLLMIHLKCTVVHYANLNSSSRNKPFLNYGPLNMLFCFFFNFLFMFILMKLLSKNLRNNYHFLIQIFKIYFKIYYITEYYDVEPCDTKMWYYSKIWKSGPFSLGPKYVFLTYFLKDYRRKFWRFRIQ